MRKVFGTNEAARCVCYAMRIGSGVVAISGAETAVDVIPRYASIRRTGGGHIVSSFVSFLLCANWSPRLVRIAQ